MFCDGIFMFIFTDIIHCGFWFCLYGFSVCMNGCMCVSKYVCASCALCWLLFVFIFLVCTVLAYWFFFYIINNIISLLLLSIILIDFCFLMREKVCIFGWLGIGTDLKGVRGRETLSRIYCMNENLLSINRKKSWRAATFIDISPVPHFWNCSLFFSNGLHF